MSVQSDIHMTGTDQRSIKPVHNDQRSISPVHNDENYSCENQLGELFIKDLRATNKFIFYFLLLNLYFIVISNEIFLNS